MTFSVNALVEKMTLQEGGYYLLKIDNQQDLIDFFCPFKRNFEKVIETKSEMNNRYIKNLIFRGMSNSEYELISSLYRDKKESFDHADTQLQEYFILRDFINACDSTGTIIPNDSVAWRKLFEDEKHIKRMVKEQANWASISELYELIGFAQHYGVPTRFLDWSYHPLVALYFASIEVIDKIFNMIHKNEDIDFNNLFMSIWIYADSNVVPEVQVIDLPKATNSHISFQKGCFTCVTQPINKLNLSQDESKTLSFLTINDVLKDKSLENNLLKVDIPYALAIDIYSYCDEYNFNGATLFRGPHGSAKYTIEKLRFKKVKYFLKNK
ncbi:FRG domain-containing protein [Acinetobacter sp. ANC 4779]|uniref:FRG domain-containing protein n=1 Tax=Acinetobacter Taxon 24C TaxID=2839060 RepID=UPI0007D865CE|nr:MULTISPECIES: FRG domain-containing protein [Acinetobacter Taxon 24C]OAL78528.1 hypothetical protein AY606_08945 [Acinetobacter sp. SFB]TCB52495.1 FRG domain-containing protein [Acinetobacter sp. ANC 4779]